MKSRSLFASLGPAIIVASIVLGPGSILASSKVGTQYGYQMLWVLAGATLLMIGMTTLGALIGVSSAHTPCEAVARRFGRGAAMAVGLIVFLIIACFQASNNLAVLAALEGFAASTAAAEEALDESAPPAPPSLSGEVSVVILLGLNVLVVAALYGMRRLYRPIERMMVVLVLVMLAGFSANLLRAGPSLLAAVQGLLPTLPTGDGGGWLPRIESRTVVDPFLALQGLFVTTLSVAGAMYQSYLVREKGWGIDDVKRGLFDSVLGITLLGFVSAMVMMTSAAALHGKVAADDLTTASDVARQLEPLFGQAATVLFSLGIFAAAFSSFLGNALVGGTIFSDGLGLGSAIDGRWTKRMTVLALLLGMLGAVAAAATGFSIVNLIIFAQALTVLGVPLLAALMIWLGFLARANGAAIPGWVLAVACVAAAVTTLLLLRIAWRLVLMLTLSLQQ